jgi:hypothetical protein
MQWRGLNLVPHFCRVPLRGVSHLISRTEMVKIGPSALRLRKVKRGGAHA